MYKIAINVRIPEVLEFLEIPTIREYREFIRK